MPRLDDVAAVRAGRGFPDPSSLTSALGAGLLTTAVNIFVSHNLLTHKRLRAVIPASPSRPWRPVMSEAIPIPDAAPTAVGWRRTIRQGREAHRKPGPFRCGLLTAINRGSGATLHMMPPQPPLLAVVGVKIFTARLRRPPVPSTVVRLSAPRGQGDPAELSRKEARF